MMGGIFGGIIAMILFKYLFPIWFALPKDYAESGPSVAEIEKRFADRGDKPEAKAALLTLVPVLLWCGLVGIVALVCAQRGKGGSDQTLLPEIYWYILPAIFGAMGISSLYYPSAIRKVLRGTGTNGDNEYALYVRLQNLKSNYRTENLSRVLAGVLLAPSLGMTILFADNYTRVADDHIALNPFFSLGETRHGYRDIERIVTAPRLFAPNGNTVERRVYLIHFQGGDKWNSDNAPGDHTDTELSQIATGVSEKSGVPVTEQEIFRRDEL